MLVKVVHHNYGIVHNQTKRNGQTSQGIQMDIHLKQVKNDSRDT